MKVFTTDHCTIPLPPGHRFPAEKYRLLREQVERDDLPGVQILRSIPATDEELLRAHTPEYLKRMTEGTLDRQEILRLGLPWSKELVERSRHSTGATIQAARAALADGIGVHLAGGTHHAFADRAEGFCVFNDAVVAARTLQSEGKVEVVAVLDADVHQGNGTAAITAGDLSIFTFSIHGQKNFPFVKVASNLDFALPDGTTDDAYLLAWRDGIRRALDLCDPDLVIYLAGADPHENDRFSRWKVTQKGLLVRDRLMLDECLERSLPTAITMAGGYGRDIHQTVEIHAQTVREAAELLSNHPFLLI